MIGKVLTVAVTLAAIVYVFWLTYVGIKRTKPKDSDESKKEAPKNN